VSGLKENWPTHPLFAGLSDSYIDWMARTASEETFEPRELIFHEGEEANTFYLITEGSVAVEVFAHQRGPVTIQTIGVGEILGWSWLVEPYRWHFDAQATAPTETITFDAKRVRESFERHSDFGYAMMNRFLPIVVQRLQATRLQLLDVYHVRH
jgi:CRP-like cAMP-binding protein